MFVPLAHDAVIEQEAVLPKITFAHTDGAGLTLSPASLRSIINTH
jgi:hypothetical protein